MKRAVDSDTDSDSDIEDGRSLVDRFIPKKMRPMVIERVAEEQRNKLQTTRRLSATSWIKWTPDWFYNNVTLPTMFPPQTEEARLLLSLRLTIAGEALLLAIPNLPANVGLIIANYFNDDVLDGLRECATTGFYKLEATRDKKWEAHAEWDLDDPDDRIDALIPRLVSASPIACAIDARFAYLLRDKLNFHKKRAWAGRYAYRLYSHVDLYGQDTAAAHCPVRQILRQLAFDQGLLPWRSNVPIGPLMTTVSVSEYDWIIDITELATSPIFTRKQILEHPLLVDVWTWLVENLMWPPSRMQPCEGDVRVTLVYLKRFLKPT